MGKALEKLFPDIVKDSPELLSYMKLDKNNITKIITDSKEIKEYTNNYKIDAIIIKKNNKKIGISLKCTGSSVVGALETSYDNIILNMDISSLEQISLKQYVNNGYIIKGMNKKDIDNISNMFKRKSYDFLDFIIRGKFRDNKDIQVNYILFYDKSKKKIYISTVNEYINFIVKNAPKGTFNSFMNITYTSGKNKVFKFKIRNPIRVKNKS